jgi:alternate signal-mediated exported protein
LQRLGAARSERFGLTRARGRRLSRPSNSFGTGGEHSARSRFSPSFNPSGFSQGHVAGWAVSPAAVPLDYVPRHAARRRVSPVRRRVVAAVAVLAVFAGTAVTFALWNAQATHAGSVVIGSGELTAVADTFEWTETSADVPDQDRQSGQDPDSETNRASLAAFHATPGDRLELRQDFAITARGRNLEFTVAADWLAGGEAGDPAPLSATYKLLTQDGEALAGGSGTLAVGDSATTIALAPGDRVITVAVTLTYSATAPQVYQPSPGASPQRAGIPVIEVTARQVRGSL